VRWHEGERERNRTFDRRKDARDFEAKVRTLSGIALSLTPRDDATSDIAR
jgi:hypothetical protein